MERERGFCRARFMRKLLWKSEKLSGHAAELFMVEKPEPTLSSIYTGERNVRRDG